MNQIEVKRRQIEIISYIIGLINLCIFGKMLGNNGITYLMISLLSFSFFATLTAGALSDSLGRILRGRNAKGQFKNAQFIRKRVMLLQGIFGIICSVAFLSLAGMMAGSIFGEVHSTFIMMVLSPTLLLMTISAVIIGYFKGEGTEMPATVSALLRQVALLGFGLLFANLLNHYGDKVSNLLGDRAYSAMYAGVGVAIAFHVAEVLVVLFLILLSIANRHTIRRQENEGMKRTESFTDTIRILFGTRGIPLLLLLLAQLPLWIGACFYRKSLADELIFAENYGMFIGKYLVLTGFIVLPLAAAQLVVNSKTVGLLRKEEQRFARNSFQGGFQFIIAVTLFFAVYVAMMAEQLSGVFNGSVSKPLTAMFQKGSVLVIIVALCIYFSRLLLLTGNPYPVLASLGCMNIIFVVLLSILLKGGKVGVMALIYATIVAGCVHCLALGFLCCRILRMQLEWIRVFVMPLITSLLAGLLCLFAGKVCTPHLGNLVTVIVSLVIAWFIYWAVLVMIRSFREQELKYIPGGRLIHAIGQLLRVF